MVSAERAVAMETTVRTQRPQFAWRMSLRAIGWIGIVSSIAGIAVLMLGQNDTTNSISIANAVRAVEAVVPLVIGIQAAFSLSPDDEPGLETLLACPRPFWWILFERLIVLLVIEFGIALIATFVSMLITGQRDLVIALARWVAPSLLFCGVATFTTIRSRQPAFSIVVVGMLWFVFSFLGGALLPDQPTFWPLTIVQPYVWMLHGFLQPGEMNVNNYWFNRVFITLVGVGLIFMALRQLRDEERVLLDGARSKSE